MDATILISDPWDFGTECGAGSFNGWVVARNESAILIGLESAVCYRRKTFCGIIAKPRHAPTFASVDSAKEPTATNLFLVTSLDALLLEQTIPVDSMVAAGSLQLR